MNFISHENTLLRREAVLQCGGFNETKGYVVEYSLWLELTKEQRQRMVDHQFPVFIIHKGSRSTASLWRFSTAVLHAFRTQREEQVIPPMGCYPDKRIYKVWKFVERQPQGWTAKLACAAPWEVGT
ncbi:MAG TPA: hypothetical protein PKW57_08915 [Anaerolineaceae bacterium]|nr:hypothetical protein [Anaerolineaceae bacterium]